MMKMLFEIWGEIIHPSSPNALKLLLVFNSVRLTKLWTHSVVWRGSSWDSKDGPFKEVYSPIFFNPASWQLLLQQSHNLCCCCCQMSYGVIRPSLPLYSKLIWAEIKVFFICLPFFLFAAVCLFQPFSLNEVFFIFLPCSVHLKSSVCRHSY